MRRLAREGVGNGKYVFLYEPSMVSRTRHGGMVYGPSYFHIVHKAAADLPKYRNMESLGAEQVAMSGATFADVLGARPVAGRLAEDMNTVAMASNRVQEKCIAPAIDAAEPVKDLQYLSPGNQILAELRAKKAGHWMNAGYANMSPGQQILFELRARRGTLRFANDPPAAGPASQPHDSKPVVEYLGHGPTEGGGYGIAFRTPQGEQQHLPVAKLRPIENEHAEDRMMEATFHNGTVANMRMPEEHRQQIFGQLLAQARQKGAVPLTPEQQLARKEQERQAARSAEMPAKPKKATAPVKKDTGGLHLEMPSIPHVGTGSARRVAQAATDVISDDWRNNIVPQLMTKFSDQPESHATMQESADFGVGKTIASTWHNVALMRKNAEQAEGPSILNAVPLVYQAVLDELPSWKPSDVSLPQFVQRVTSKYFNRLTREPEPTERPFGGDDDNGEGGRPVHQDPTERA